MTETTYATIRVEVDGAIATLTLHRPDRMNSMTNRMVRETRQALLAASADSSIRVLVLTGTGRSFCPGADINRVAERADEERLDVSDFEVPVLLHEMPAVTIAAVNGACAGAGLGWACACDLRLATRSAQFNTAFLDVGVAGDMGGPWTLPRIVGAARARELYLLPDKFAADDALQIGLVSRVVDDHVFAEEVRALAGRLAAAAPIALRTLKANFVQAERMDFATYVGYETERHLEMFTTYDTHEAFAAKAEKRPPRFEGR
jgi:2-(1,2-epoxy-1,2-dihydrophenyl)acetyl-CoA isomerase